MEHPPAGIVGHLRYFVAVAEAVAGKVLIIV
jgi:hypothetical protein